MVPAKNLNNPSQTNVAPWVGGMDGRMDSANNLLPKKSLTNSPSCVVFVFVSPEHLSFLGGDVAKENARKVTLKQL